MKKRGRSEQIFLFIGMYAGYSGFRFVAHVNDLHNIIVDMWNQHKVEEKTRLGVGSELFYFGYRNYEEMQKVVTGCQERTCRENFYISGKLKKRLCM